MLNSDWLKQDHWHFYFIQAMHSKGLACRQIL